MDYVSGIKAKNVALKKLPQRHIVADSILLVELALTGSLAIVVSLPQLMKWGNVIAHKLHIFLNTLLLFL